MNAPFPPAVCRHDWDDAGSCAFACRKCGATYTYEPDQPDPAYDVYTATDTAEEPPYHEQEAAAGIYDGGEYDPCHSRHLSLTRSRLSWAGLDPVRARQVGTHGLAGH